VKRYKTLNVIKKDKHLVFSTRLENCGEEYYTRKGQYAISALTSIDDKKHICYASVGWPDSIYGSHIWSNFEIIHNI
jgi:hypothetical protein